MLIDAGDKNDVHHFKEVLSPAPNANCKMFINVSRKLWLCLVEKLLVIFGSNKPLVFYILIKLNHLVF